MKAGKSKPLARRINLDYSGKRNHALPEDAESFKHYCSICFQVYNGMIDAQACCIKAKLLRGMVSDRSPLNGHSKPKHEPIGVLSRMCKKIIYYPEPPAEESINVT